MYIPNRGSHVDYSGGIRTYLWTLWLLYRAAEVSCEFSMPQIKRQKRLFNKIVHPFAQRQ